MIRIAFILKNRFLENIIIFIKVLFLHIMDLFQYILNNKMIIME